jgi:hypothetical protein
MKPSDFGQVPATALTGDQKLKRLWELGVTPADVQLHNKFHEHKGMQEGVSCLWEKHLSHPEMNVYWILSAKKKEEEVSLP